MGIQLRLWLSCGRQLMDGLLTPLGPQRYTLPYSHSLHQHWFVHLPLKSSVRDSTTITLHVTFLLVLATRKRYLAELVGMIILPSVLVGPLFSLCFFGVTFLFTYTLLAPAVVNVRKAENI